MKNHDSQECIPVVDIRIPSSVEQSIVPMTLHISIREYHLDIIANELGFDDGANVMISRYDDWWHYSKVFDFLWLLTK